MKELTIEEKAKAYDEALVWMRDLYPSMIGAMKEDAEHYFPELKESEDEKIRKHIVTFIMEAEKMGDAPEECAKWLAWLEKQGSQILANSAKTCKDEQTQEVDLTKEIAHFALNGGTGDNTPTIGEIAKHFFELGLSASNPTTAEDRGTAEEIIINLKRVESDYRIDLTKEIEWLRNKVKK